MLDDGTVDDEVEDRSTGPLGSSGGGSERAFPVVGIGASAGGLEACRALLERLPAELGMAVVVVLHLDPNRESELASILATNTKMPVVQVEDGMPLRPNAVFVIPPNAGMDVVWERLRLMPRAEVQGQFMPIDLLFRSMAKQWGDRSVGVILSGGGTDGVLGIEAIKGAEGITFAQDDSAQHGSMPRSAAASGCVDHVLPPDRIAEELTRIARHSYMEGPADDREAETPPTERKTELNRIFKLVREATGVDFGGYKRNSILRRIRRRMALRHIEELGDYVETLAADPSEVEALYHDFLIRVTSFFRDPEAFEALKREVIPALIRNRPPNVPIRIWTAGCASGEEVYSLAICLLEALGDMAGNTPIKILATDVNESYLEIARLGRYIENIALDVSGDRLRRFFVRSDGHYQITKAVRDLCIFSRHDLTRDPPFARLDLVSCRNLLIYLDLPAQKRVLPMFHYALNPGGTLMLGPSETVGSFGDLFRPIDPEHKLFARQVAIGRPASGFTRDDPSTGARRRWSMPGEVAGNPRNGLQHEADRILLARYAPPGVLIDEDLKIQQFRGRTDPYLANNPGAASHDLIRMAREGLADGLRSAVDQARAEGLPARRRGLRLTQGEDVRLVDVQVIPMTATEVPPCYLVLFEERLAEILDGPPPAREMSEATEDLSPEEARREVDALGRELSATRAYLQSLVEENEATTEELRSANEEVLSSNEELQSTNEELQTAKEEMQSANEELSTVNDELNHRNDALGRSNDDLVNLFGCVNIPIVMVNRERLIRRYTTPAERLLNLIPADLGRPIGNIRPNLDLDDLDRLIGTVIQTLTPKDLEVRDLDGRWHSLRLRPYITLDNKIDGAVMALVDIDDIKRGAEQLEIARDAAESIVEAVWQPLVVLDDGLRVNRANRAFYQTFRLSMDQVIGHPLADLFDGSWDDPTLLDLLGTVLPEQVTLRNLELENEFGAIGHRAFRLNARPIHFGSDGTAVILMAMEDITETRRETDRQQALHREQAARVEAERSNQRKDEFLAMLAHELRNPLSPILNALLLLRGPDPDPRDIEWGLEVMERQVRHMARLIDDLLDVSRVTRGGIELRRERIDLVRSLRHAADGARPLIETRRHTLELALPDRPIELTLDPVRIEQVLTNLLNNAAKYTPEGGQIRLSMAVEGSEVVVRVRDNGYGIAPEQLREVFDLFMQVDRTLERSLGGLGIGLTLVKTLVELHGGSVEARSEGRGQGSEFIVRLPLDVRASTPTSASKDDEGLNGSRRVLIVDDNRDAARSLALLLKRYGHVVETADDGPAGLEAARAFAPEIALLDIGLPGMDGHELARHLRADEALRDVVLVALTGYGTESDRLDALEAGFDGHATKPVDLQRLREIIRITRE